MDVIILAAGLGDRLGDFTEDRPKALVQVAGRELILRALDFLDHPSIEKRTVITGYRGKLLTDFLHAHAPEVDTLHNPHFEAGNILSVEAARPAMTGPFLLMNVDHIYPKRLLPLLLTEQKGISVVCDFDRTLGDDDMKVRKNKQGTLAAIRKNLTTFDGGYIGMTMVDASSIASYQEAITEVKRIFGEGASAEWIVGHLAEREVPIHMIDTSGTHWLEVDTPDDLRRAEETLLRDKDLLR